MQSEMLKDLTGKKLHDALAKELHSVPVFSAIRNQQNTISERLLVLTKFKTVAESSMVTPDQLLIFPS
jgi:hypothetical protein